MSASTAPASAEWQSALARMLWEGDRQQFAEFIAAGEMPREIQLEIGRLLTAPRDAVLRLIVEVSQREARRLRTVVESAVKGIEVDRASAGGKRYAGAHIGRRRGKGSRSKLFADRALLTDAVNAFRAALRHGARTSAMRSPRRGAPVTRLRSLCSRRCWR